MKGWTDEQKRAMAEIQQIKKTQRQEAEERRSRTESAFKSAEALIRLKNQGFEALVNAHMEETGCSRGDAVAYIAKEYPEDHEAYIKAVNS